MSLSATEFSTVAAHVRHRTGIVLDAGKEYLVESRLTGLARSLGGATTIPQLVDEVVRRPDGPMATRVVEAMTTHESSWFRDPKVFAAIRTVVFPTLLERRRAVRRLTIWSAGASTGQEPYSIALQLLEHFPECAGWKVRIVGTDVSGAALDRARAAVYSQFEVNRGLPASMLVRYFRQEGASYLLDERVRSMVEFEPFNLIGGDWRSAPRADLVLLRNVLIYFDVAERARVLSNVAGAMAPDGVVLLGGTESGGALGDGLERVRLGGCTFLAPAAPTGTGGWGDTAAARMEATT